MREFAKCFNIPRTLLVTQQDYDNNNNNNNTRTSVVTQQDYEQCRGQNFFKIIKALIHRFGFIYFYMTLKSLLFEA